MQLNWLDWTIVTGNLAVVLAIGVFAARRSGAGVGGFFLSGRTMPWWLLGASMVATTFSTDTPNLVTDIVRQDGVSGNWAWWAFLITGMVTVFFYSRMWRRSNVLTDMEFYELRYDGPSAVFLRGFRSIYLGLVFNCLMLSVVSLAAIKIGQIMLGLSPVETIVIVSVVTALFTSVGGFLGVVLTDLLLFVTAMVGSVLAAWYSIHLPEVGGLEALLAHDAVSPKLDLLPPLLGSTGAPTTALVELLLIPLAVQWWAAWYPGAEPGGGGYVAQRMLAAKDERHALGATLFFNVAHYALRPWPWILVALCSLIVFPDLESLHTAFPDVDPSKLGNDLAYPAMLTFLPHGVLGLVVASLIAAYMSTVSTHLNWGASYLVHDFYKRFIRRGASENEQVWCGRGVTVVIMALSAWLALMIQNAKQVFDITLMFGAGSGLVFLLRWYWWRVNAPAEIAAMLGSGAVAMLIEFTAIGAAIPEPWDLPVAVLCTTAIWAGTMYCTRPTSDEQLKSFVRKIGPAGPGWRRVHAEILTDDRPVPSEPRSLSRAALSVLLGCVVVYATLFFIGLCLYSRPLQACAALAVVVGAATLLIRVNATQSR